VKYIIPQRLLAKQAVNKNRASVSVKMGRMANLIFGLGIISGAFCVGE